MADLTATLNRLQECLCAALEAGGNPPCFCCVIHAPGPPLAPDGPYGDACKCGMAWVRLVEVAPARQTGISKKLANGEVCVRPAITNATIELGVLRCTNATIVKAADLCECLGAHAADAAADVGALIAAAICCNVTWERLVPVGNDTCAGSTLRVVVPIDICAECPPESPGESP